MRSSDYRELLIEQEKAFQIYMKENQTFKNSSYTIPVVVHIIKNEFDENWVDMNITDAYDYASKVMVENMLKLDAKEGIDAFIDKREPKWRDK